MVQSGDCSVSSGTSRCVRSATEHPSDHGATTDDQGLGRCQPHSFCRCADVARGTAGGVSGLLGPGPDAAVDEFHPFLDGSGGYVDQLKAVVPVRLLVETLECD